MLNTLLRVFILTFITTNICAQTLNVPPRNVSALTGTQVVADITSLSLTDRENYIMNEVLNGNVPDFQRTMIPVTDSALIGGSYQHVTYYVIPDYLALGSDADYYLCPMTPILAQRLADSLDCLLPTRKMVDNIWSHATVKMNPESIPPSPQMTTVPVMDDHNDMVWTQRQTFLPTYPLGELVSGDKKDVIISNLIYTSPSPARVVIYGWHYTSGTNIQPMYAGHIDTYADYSHGIRMVQDEVYLDGVPTSASAILASSTLHTLLSDEGIMTQPFYPDTASGVVVTPIPDTPKSFCVLRESNTSVRVIIKSDPNTTEYDVQISSDGINFSFHSSQSSNDFVISNLTPDVITYVRLFASNSSGSSTASEVLGAVPSSDPHQIIIVNGFDRASTGNTYNFIKQHGKAVLNYNMAFSSATNDALLDNLVNIQTFDAVDLILGEESTVDETFSTSEQSIYADYLDNEGFLFVSGAEIGWDLDFKGTSADQDFYHNYLKSIYIQDAPDNTASTYYSFEDVNGSLFDGLGSTSFDDGSNGTFNVDYPDVIDTINGSNRILSYTGLTNNFAGVSFEGIFPGGVDTAKVVNLGIPFEAIYPENKRFTIMENILDFFFAENTPIPGSGIAENNLDIHFYPNPTSDIVHFEYPVDQVTVFDLSGRSLMSFNQVSNINLSKLTSGSYLIRFNVNDQHRTYTLIKQ